MVAGSGVRVVSRDQRRNGVSCQNVALVVGATGIVGEKLLEILPMSDTPGGPWKVYGLARGDRPSALVSEQIYIQCDLLNRNEVDLKLAPLTDVTHLFWTAWLPKPSEEECCSDNGEMFDHVLRVLLSASTSLKHVCLQTGTKHYIAPYFQGKGQTRCSPFQEYMPRFPGLNFYHTLEDMLFKVHKLSQGKITWSVHRPTVIIGVGERGYFNLMRTLAMYGTICKREALPFVFPGNKVTWEQMSDVANADIIAEQEIWAATDPKAMNQAFNVTNGDVINWRNLWPLLAAKLGLDFVPYSGQPTPLAQTMANKEPIWEAIVRENDLVPCKLADFAHWELWDFVFGFPFEHVSSTNKRKEFGFLSFRNTEDTFLCSIDELRRRRIIPYL